ncbi:MAG: ComF family protein [Phycisphaerales bacterium]
MVALLRSVLSWLDIVECEWLGGDSSARLLAQLTPPDDGAAWCHRCGLTVARGERRAPCVTCEGHRLPYGRVVRLGEMAGGWKYLIHSVKYGRDPVAAEILGRRLGEQYAACTEEEVRSDRIVVPMPAAPIRAWHRGIDTTREIAIALARTLSAPLIRPLLHRGGPPRSSQSRQERASRRFSVKRGWRPGDLAGLHVLIVDDVLTTGTTIREASRLLRHLGAASVEAAVVAVTPEGARRLASRSQNLDSTP